MRAVTTTVYLQRIETLVPPHAYAQSYARDRMMEWGGDAATARYVRAIYDRSGIEKRHSVLPDFLPGATPELFDVSNGLSNPTTAERNRCYIRHARPMAVEVARRVGVADVTHVITVSCTGFYNPGADYDIVTQLGLPGTTERYHLGFMGCYAAFPALRMAQQFCVANPQAVVLVVCLELCSLHLQIRPDPDTLLANALFADGAAAVIVSAREPVGPALALREFRPALAPEGKTAMAWEIGNHGFDISLSSYVPDIIGANLDPLRDIAADFWAVHPGGRAIIDKVQDGLALKPGQVAASRAVLRDYGNMSSVTILFVLQRLLREAQPGIIGALAFGPGLTIESAVMELVPAREACAVGC